MAEPSTHPCSGLGHNCCSPVSSPARGTCSSLMATLHDSGFAEQNKNSELITGGKTRVRGIAVNIYIFGAFNVIAIFPFCV